MNLKTLLLAGIALLFVLTTSCITSEKTLYNWENYEQVSYNYSKDPSEKNLKELEECYAKMTEKQKGLRRVLPPGIFAERAFLLIKQGKKDDAIALLKSEIKLYPESKPFIDKIIKQLEK